MSVWVKKVGWMFSIGAVLVSPIRAEEHSYQFSYSDLDNFRRAYELIEGGADPIESLQAEYFDKGTPGLAEYARRFDLTADSLAEKMDEMPKYYASLFDLRERVEAEASAIAAALDEMKANYPEAVFPPVYFVVGHLKAGGQASAVGALIGSEIFARKSDTDLVELESRRFYDPSVLPAIVAHEMSHIQQARAQGLEQYVSIYGENRSVLKNAIREGTAVWFTETIAGQMFEPEVRAWVIEHEEEIWDIFQQEMHGDDFDPWFGAAPEDRDWPYDVGYFLGSRIVEAYYRNSSDPEAALREILGVIDYDAFLEASGYRPGFDRDE